jgi:REP element-mobilizing transposase RayT
MGPRDNKIVMARPLRLEHADALWHITSRGNERRPIFRDDEDRRVFLNVLSGVIRRFRWRLHAYVLMGNHYHLLIETPGGLLVAGMKWLQGTYTQRFNSRHKVYGHLFQGRYKAMNVDEGQAGYFQIVSTYIHLNPVRAGLVRAGEQRLRSYGWSSYPSYVVAEAKRPAWLRVDRVLGSVGIGVDDSRGRQGYEAWMEGRVLECVRSRSRKEMETEWRSVRRGWYLGDRSFKSKLLDRIGGMLEGRKADSVNGEAVGAWSREEAERWIGSTLAELGLDEAGLRRIPKGAKEKMAMAWWLRRHTTLSRQWIAQRLQMGHETRVTLAVREVGAGAQGRLTKLKQQVERARSPNVS